MLPIIPKNFGIKLIPNNGIEKQFQTIEKLVQECDEVINCGDAGQEGELIQRWVLQKAKCNKPMKRLWISSLTEDAIKEGFANLKPAENYQNLYLAGNARAIGVPSLTRSGPARSPQFLGTQLRDRRANNLLGKAGPHRRNQR